MCWHKWSLWKIVDRGKIYEYNSREVGQWRSGPEKDEKHFVGTFIVQERTCSKCGKVQVSEDKTSIY